MDGLSDRSSILLRSTKKTALYVAKAIYSAVIFMLRYGYKFSKTELGGDEIMRDYAVLTSNGNFTIFEYDNEKIRFATSKRLEKYTKVVEWDHGYLVVMANTKGWMKLKNTLTLFQYWKTYIMM